MSNCVRGRSAARITRALERAKASRAPPRSPWAPCGGRRGTGTKGECAKCLKTTRFYPKLEPAGGSET